MGSCHDKSLTYLAGFGYNVIQHPNKTFAPLQMLGRQNNTFLVLGPISGLISKGATSTPQITTNQPSANINGQTSDTFKLSLGISILGNLIGALTGTNLGVKATFTNAHNLAFEYSDVLVDSAVPFDVGNYLKDGQVDSGNPILAQYVMGHGDLFLITEIIKSNNFSINLTRNDSTALTVDVPVIQAAASGNATVSGTGTAAAKITFKGSEAIPFGFKCFQVGVANQHLTLIIAQPGSVYGASLGEGLRRPVAIYHASAPIPVVFTDGLLDVAVGPN